MTNVAARRNFATVGPSNEGPEVTSMSADGTARRPPDVRRRPQGRASRPTLADEWSGRIPAMRRRLLIGPQDGSVYSRRPNGREAHFATRNAERSPSLI